MPEQLQAVFQPANLSAAWKRIRTRSHMPGSDGVSIDMFGVRWQSDAAALETQVTGGTYVAAPLIPFSIAKPSGGERRLYLLALRDRFLQTAVLQIVEPLLEPTFSPRSHGWRPQRSRQTAIAMAATELPERPFACRLDITSFFASLDQPKLVAAIEASGGLDSDLRGLLVRLLRAKVTEAGQETFLERGVPQGAPLSPLLGNLYLTGFDAALEKEGFHFVRFGDDILALEKREEGARHALLKIRECLGEVGLEANSAKTFVGRIDEGFRYLGEALRPASHVAPKIPPDAVLLDQRRSLYICTPGLVVHRMGQSLEVKKEQQTLLRVPVHKLQSLNLIGNCMVTLPALRLAASHRLEIYLLNAGGGYLAHLVGPRQPDLELERRQWVRTVEGPFTLPVAKSLVIGKLRNGETVLRYLGALPRQDETAAPPHLESVRLAHLRSRCHKVTSRSELMGLEGRAAALYFPLFSKLLPPAFQFARRSAHPPADPTNSLLSFAYTLLLQNIGAALRAEHLNPDLGFLHVPRPGFPALSCDLMEEFRAPVADRLVAGLLTEGAFQPADFEPGTSGYWLKSPARRIFLARFEELLWECPLDRRHNWRELFRRQASRLADVLLDRAPEYQPFVWSPPCT